MAEQKRDYYEVLGVSKNASDADIKRAYRKLAKEMCIRDRYTALGVYLPLITTNCAVLGVSINNVSYGYNLIESVVYGVTGGLGFMLAIVLFASIRERLEFAQCPKCFEGIPLAMVTAGLMALAFMGFSGLQVW